jgi:hydrogenase maturation protease
MDFNRMRTLVLGLGNPLLRDDSVGLRVVQELRVRLGEVPDIEVSEDYWGGLRLMERMVGYDRAIIIDAICTDSEPGTIHLLSPNDIPTQRSASVHDVNLPTALELGRQAGAQLPPSSEILIVGVEAADVQTFNETLTPEVETALPKAVEAVIAELDREREKT